MSVKDVARAAGVSVGTVSNVLNRPERVSPAIVERVLEVIAEQGFVRNDAARQLRAGRSRTIGLVVLDARNPFFMALARGAEQEAARNGLAVVIANSDGDAEREAAYLDYFEQQRAFGILLSPTSARLPQIDRLTGRGTRTVLLDSTWDGAAVPSVVVDDVEGGRLAAAHLVDGGRRRLMFAGGPLALDQVSDRLRGATEVAQAHGVEIEVLTTPSLTVEDGRWVAHRIAERAPGNRPDAVFAANDLIGLGIVQTLPAVSRLRIPDDLAVIGYDDIDFASAAIVPLSSVRQPAELMGKRGAEILLQTNTDGPKTVRFLPELVVRASTVKTELDPRE